MKRLAKYTSVWGENWIVGRYLLPHLQRLGRDTQGVFLDLACGESPFRQYFPGVKCYLRMDYASAVKSIRCDMRFLPLRNQSVDTVLIAQALSDVGEPAAVLAEVRRVLKTNGRLLIFESMAYPEHDLPHDYFRLLPNGLKVLAAGQGLAVSECLYLGGLGSRFASLWNSCCMGKLLTVPGLQPLAWLGVLAGNLVFGAVDRFFPHPRLASDYLAVLRPETASDLAARPAA